MKARFLSLLADLVYPPRCPVCNDIVTAGGGGICENCRQKISYVTEPYCMKCGKPIENEENEFCRDCLDKKHSFNEGRSVLVYDEYMSRSIYRFKYNSKKEYARIYGQLISDRLGSKIRSWNADALLPVPIHKSRMKKRGYNQATLIAREVSKRLNIPVRDNILIRKTQTKAQKSLGAAERENNLKKAFIVRKNSVKLNTVIVIDDIYTTGSTIDAVSAVLKESGVSNVYFVTLCIGRGI